jgi:hypothetical protein
MVMYKRFEVGEVCDGRERGKGREAIVHFCAITAQSLRHSYKKKRRGKIRRERRGDQQKIEKGKKSNEWR